MVELQIPPLRDRLEDVPLLVDHFCERFNRRFKKTLPGVSDEVLNLFMDYAWPGNVRELRHALEHAFVLRSFGRIEADHLPKEIRAKDRKSGHFPTGKSRQSPALILQALERSGWNKAKNIVRSLMFVNGKQVESRAACHKS